MWWGRRREGLPGGHREPGVAHGGGSAAASTSAGMARASPVSRWRMWSARPGRRFCRVGKVSAQDAQWASWRESAT